MCLYKVLYTFSSSFVQQKPLSDIHLKMELKTISILICFQTPLVSVCLVYTTEEVYVPVLLISPTMLYKKITIIIIIIIPDLLKICLNSALYV